MSLRELLHRGYFPKELPRPFVTEPFATKITCATTLPGDFTKWPAKGNKFPAAKTTLYSHPRSGLFRRLLSICNPVCYYLLSKELVENWAVIAPMVSGSPLAATSPEFKRHKNDRAINGKWSLTDRPDLAQIGRLGRRYVLQTDINRFYPSIYTHSIPWALHTKPVAKSNHSLALLGNNLDYWVRMGQDQQTVGIPIGPDTSLVLAELIMHRCDEELVKKLPQVKGHRFIDDYELSFETRTEAEDAFHVLEMCLAEYELALNPKKTQVMDLPLPLEATWATVLKQFTFRNSKAAQAADLSSFFSTAYSLHTEYPEDAVLQFAVARLRSLSLDPANWPLFQRLLLLCVIPNPASFPYVLERIIRYKNAGATPMLSDLEEIANTIIVRHSVLNHSSEVANAVWACLALGLRMHDQAVDSISRCDDVVVALLALHCEQQGLTSKPIDKTVWSTHMTDDSLYDEYWLLAYEANIKGWLPPLNGSDYVAADANFGFLKANGVFFYDTALAVPAGTAPIPLPSLPTVPPFSSKYSPSVPL